MQNTVEVLQHRLQDGYKPGIDNDGHQVWITSDGGASKGIIPLGAGFQMAESGHLSVVDGFGGSSSGALSMASVMTCQVANAREVFFTLTERGFYVNHKRPVRSMIGFAYGQVHPGLTPLPFVDMSALEEIMTKERPLDVIKLAHYPQPLLIGASNLTLGRAEKFSTHEYKDDPDEIIKALLAGAHLPLSMAGPYPEIRGHAYSDAGIFWPTTADIVKSTGKPTHIISLASAPLPRKAGGIVQNGADIIQGAFCQRYSRLGGVVSRVATAQRDHIIAGLISGDGTMEFDNVSLTRISPALDGPLPNRRTSDRATLDRGFEAGRQAVVAAFQNAALLKSPV